MTLAPETLALLRPFTELERVRPRRLDDPELLGFAGVSRHGLYRLIEAGVLVPERAPVPGSRCFLTVEQIATWRASRTTPANEEALVGKTRAGRDQHANEHPKSITT